MQTDYITVPVLYNTKETAEQENLGIPIDDDSYEVRDVCFFTIDNVANAHPDEVARSIIFSGGARFESTLTADEIMSRIRHHKTL